MSREGGVMLSKASKKERIRREFVRLKKLFNSLPDNEQEFIEPLLKQSAFLYITLCDLAEKINTEGTTEQYQNGKNQHGMKMSADIQAYNQTAKIYHNLMIKLRERLPKEQSGSVLAEMMLEDE